MLINIEGKTELILNSLLNIIYNEFEKELLIVDSKVISNAISSTSKITGDCTIN